MDHKDNYRMSLLSPNPISLRRRFALGFLKALTRIHNHRPGSGSNSPIEAAKRRRRVKAAADTAMASAVGPSRVWSRAVLLRCHKRRRLLFRRSSMMIRINGRRETIKKGNRKIGVFAIGQEKKLRNLVPGGEHMDTYKLLDETFDYIRCLTTQVQVMKRIMDVYCSTT